MFFGKEFERVESQLAQTMVRAKYREQVLLMEKRSGDHRFMQTCTVVGCIIIFFVPGFFIHKRLSKRAGRVLPAACLLLPSSEPLCGKTQMQPRLTIPAIEQGARFLPTKGE